MQMEFISAVQPPDWSVIILGSTPLILRLSVIFNLANLLLLLLLLLPLIWTNLKARTRLPVYLRCQKPLKNTTEREEDEVASAAMSTYECL